MQYDCRALPINYIFNSQYIVYHVHLLYVSYHENVIRSNYPHVKVSGIISRSVSFAMWSALILQTELTNLIESVRNTMK